LDRWSFIPASMDCCLSSGRSLAVRAMMGMLAPCWPDARIRLATSMPVMPGMRMSIRTTSGRCRSARSNAWGTPDTASVTRIFEKNIKCLDELLYRRIEPVVIMATLSGFYIDLYRAKVANLSGKNTADIVKTFSYGSRAFVVDKAFRESASYSEQSLVDSLEVLRRGDEMLKGSRVEDSIILQQTLTRLFACRRRG